MTKLSERTAHKLPQAPQNLSAALAITAALTQDTSSKDMTACNNDDGDKRGSALHTLFINTNMCGEVGAFAVADMLRTNNTLTELDISYNPLSSRGVTSIAEELQLNKTLQIIFLDSTECGNDRVVAIADMLHSILKLINNS